MKALDEIRAEINAKAQSEIARAEKEIDIRGQLTIQPKYVHIYPLYNSAGSVVYEAKTKAEAFEIYKTFNVFPSFLCKGAPGTSVKCFDDERAKEVIEYFAGVEISQYGSKLKFYTNIGGEFWRVEIALPLHFFGRFRKDAPNARINYRLYFEPLPAFNTLHRICKYAGSGRGDASHGGEIWAMYEAYEINNLLDVGEAR